MPVEIRVGPPVVIINQGKTFLVTDQQGDIHEQSELGAFSDDTRDSLIVSLQNLAVHPLFARAALAELGRLQATASTTTGTSSPARSCTRCRMGSWRRSG